MNYIDAEKMATDMLSRMPDAFLLLHGMSMKTDLINALMAL
jgi:hypothetical protein